MRSLLSSLADSTLPSVICFIAAEVSIRGGPDSENIMPKTSALMRTKIHDQLRRDLRGEPVPRPDLHPREAGFDELLGELARPLEPPLHVAIRARVDARVVDADRIAHAAPEERRDREPGALSEDPTARCRAPRARAPPRPPSRGSSRRQRRSARSPRCGAHPSRGRAARSDRGRWLRRHRARNRSRRARSRRARR